MLTIRTNKHPTETDILRFVRTCEMYEKDS